MKLLRATVKGRPGPSDAEPDHPPRRIGSHEIRALVLLLGTSLAAGGEPPPSGPPARRANHLVSEKSPYLLQHAHNPVDWFPWGEEAFAKARAEKKPIFLSIGYSTCHWCHVMERESFENAEIARILNESFVAIKVDREERPDVDDVYMTAVQTLFGRGGWPLSVFLTPEGKPFFGGTYFPPEDDPERGRGFRPLLLLVAKKWQDERERIDSSATGIVDKLREILVPEAKLASANQSLTPAHLEAGFAAFRDQFDGKNGGFGGSPKFPRSSALDFLLFHSARTGSADARSMALRTLDGMARGGIRDHLAGGFHRYSTDAEWTVPHFEKMLYDQALISRAYFDAGRLAGEARYFQVGRETLDYVLVRLSQPQGGFFSAEDADSEGDEGKYYVWTRAEIISILGEEDGRLFADFHGVSAEGNFEGSQRSVLTTRRDLAELGAGVPGGAATLEARLGTARKRLLQVREKRVPPARDDKVLTDWNGLMISALAVGYQATGENGYLQAAEKAADFIRKTMVREDGRLLHRFRDGEAKIPAFLDDYSFLTAGLLDLYEAGFRVERLREAVRLAREMVRLFWDGKEGGFFPTGPDHQTLILRKKEFYDGAIPSGNSVAFLDLLRLAELTGDADFRAKAAALEVLSAARLSASPYEHPQLLVAASFRLSKPRQVAVVGGREDAHAADMLREVHRRYQPAMVFARLVPGDTAAQALLPFLEGKLAIDGKATAYVCRDGTCKLPAKNVAELQKQLVEE